MEFSISSKFLNVSAEKYLWYSFMTFLNVCRNCSNVLFYIIDVFICVFFVFLKTSAWLTNFIKLFEDQAFDFVDYFY